MEKELTKEQVIAFADSGIWKGWTNEQIVRFQLFQRKMCMPFSRFHEALEDVLKRPVYTHEFAFNPGGIELEYLGEKEPPTFNEIIEMIPEDKRIILNL